MSATIDLDKISTCGYYTTSSPSVTIGNYTTDKVTVTTGTASVYTAPKSWTYSTSTPVTISYDDICKIYNVEPEPEKKEEKEMKKKKPQRRENPYTKKIKEHLERQKKSRYTYFSYVKEYVPNKVYEFTFANEIHKIKTICDDDDIFDLEKAFYIAIAKRNFPNFTPEGYVKQSEIYTYDKDYIKIVQNGIKLFNLLKQEEEFEKEEDERIKRKHEKYVQKKKNRALRKKNNANQDLYDTIKKAIEDAK